MLESTKQLAETLGEALLAKNWQVTCAESCTGGGVAQAITAIPGSSQWFESGFVTYSNGAKTRLLGVSDKKLTDVGAVSEAVVVEMARGALVRANADLAVAVSGIAGPDGGSVDKPVGTVWFAWVSAQSELTLCEHFNGNRASVREQAVVRALKGLLSVAKTA